MWKTFTANITSKGFLSCVDSYVSVETVLMSKYVSTNITTKGFLSCVNSHVSLKMGFLMKPLFANITSKYFLACVNYIFLQSGSFLINQTAGRVFCWMTFLVPLKRSLVEVLFITLGAAKEWNICLAVVLGQSLMKLWEAGLLQTIKLLSFLTGDEFRLFLLHVKEVWVLLLQTGVWGNTFINLDSCRTYSNKCTLWRPGVSTHILSSFNIWNKMNNKLLLIYFVDFNNKTGPSLFPWFQQLSFNQLVIIVRLQIITNFGSHSIKCICK